LDARKTASDDPALRALAAIWLRDSFDGVESTAAVLRRHRRATQ
jgi:hypothetical protein